MLSEVERGMEHSQAGIYSGDKNIISRQEWGCQARHRNVFESRSAWKILVLLSNKPTPPGRV